MSNLVRICLRTTVQFFIDIFENFAYTISADRDMLYTCVTELTFKRHAMSSATGAASRRFFFTKENLDGNNYLF